MFVPPDACCVRAADVRSCLPFLQPQKSNAGVHGNSLEKALRNNRYKCAFTGSEPDEVSLRTYQVHKVQILSHGSSF